MMRVRMAALLILLSLTVWVHPSLARDQADLEAEAPGRPIYIQPSPLASLIDALPGMPDRARLDLAGIVVNGLAQAYEAELALAMQEFELGSGGGRNVTQWYLATAPMLAELRARQAELHEAEVVEVHMEAYNQLLLVIDGRPLWAAWPRPSAQRALERELVSEFCRLHDCPESSDDGFPPAVMEQFTASGQWVLSQYRPPTWESTEGVNCEFQEYSRISEKEGRCQAVIADLHVLVTALRAAQRNGERITWSYLALRKSSGELQSITVNEHGDYIAALVPALAVDAFDWEEAQRWLRARIEGRSARATVLRAPRG